MARRDGPRGPVPAGRPTRIELAGSSRGASTGPVDGRSRRSHFGTPGLARPAPRLAFPSRNHGSSAARSRRRLAVGRRPGPSLVGAPASVQSSARPDRPFCARPGCGGPGGGFRLERWWTRGRRSLLSRQGRGRLRRLGSRQHRPLRGATVSARRRRRSGRRRCRGRGRRRRQGLCCRGPSRSPTSGRGLRRRRRRFGELGYCRLPGGGRGSRRAARALMARIDLNLRLVLGLPPPATAVHGGRWRGTPPSGESQGWPLPTRIWHKPVAGPSNNMDVNEGPNPKRERFCCRFSDAWSGLVFPPLHAAAVEACLDRKLVWPVIGGRNLCLARAYPDN